MASEFDLQEELQALQDSGNYSIHHEHDIRSMQPGEMDALLQRYPSHSRVLRSRHISRYVL
ncbi:hypothetical protein BGW80DRAFT_1349528, partial [Lactifluus volemus]